MKHAAVLFIITLNATAHALPANPYRPGSVPTSELPANPYLIVLAERLADRPTEPPKRFPGLRPGAWKRLIGAAALLPAAAWRHVAMHEGAHIATAASYGAVITDFHIGPQKCRPEWGCKWRFGYFRYDDPDGRVDAKEKALVQAAPLVMDIAIFASTDLLLSHNLDDDSFEATLALLGGMIMPLLDFSINTLGPGADEINAIADATGIPKDAWRAVGGALTAVGVWRIIDQSRHLFLAGQRREAKSPNGITIFPMMSSTTVGLALTGAF